ncbi:MAG: hypothetical protein KIT84_38835 [Labilithrix sp.]|nr:hypothetical protein [Labilithrix sp.]MCW5817018.1 hypothetical protein [Labilithrix sp.]
MVTAIHHAPLVVAQEGHDITIGVSIERADQIKRALVVYKGEKAAGEVELARSSDPERPYVAIVPALAVHAPLVSYAIEVETTDGARVPVFATRAEPHRVTVLDSAEDAREGTLLARLEGRRSVVLGSGEYASFDRARDSFWRTEGSYTYRMLGFVSEFGMRAGVVRGQTGRDERQVGLNYGAPRLRVRFADVLHVEGELLVSVTEVGFSNGGGGAIILGDAYGSNLTLGFEAVQVFGVRGYTRLDLVANRWLTVAPTVEVTNMPHAEDVGVRLLGDARFAFGRGFFAGVRAGYQARSFAAGGPSIGGSLGYGF